MLLNRKFLLSIVVALPLGVAGTAQQFDARQWATLYDGKNLDAWEVRGEGLWTILHDGTLLGQRSHPNPGNPFEDAGPFTVKQYRDWLNRQAWLYTKHEFGEYDLHLEYLIPPHGNSGVSIRDVSRGHYVIGEAADVRKPIATALTGSPAHVGYEIQIIDGDDQAYPAGSVYLFAKAKTGLQKAGEWNSMDVESRTDAIRVKVNGVLAAEYAGAPDRSKTGPIGLQLHDQFTFAMFRNIRIREIPAGK